MTRTLLIGATGQLGSELARLRAGPNLVAVSHDELEITDAAAVDALPATARPDVVVNTSAFHAVDGCEDEHTSELQSPCNLVCRLLLEKKKNKRRSSA